MKYESTNHNQQYKKNPDNIKNDNDDLYIILNEIKSCVEAIKENFYEIKLELDRPLNHYEDCEYTSIGHIEYLWDLYKTLEKLDKQHIADYNAKIAQEAIEAFSNVLQNTHDHLVSITKQSSMSDLEDISVWAEEFAIEYSNDMRNV